MSFQTFGLSAPILKALAAEGYETPTPIQTQAIPPVMEGRDLCGIAQTGTGKTAAFSLPILHRLSANPRPALRKGCRALILSPTRELASQIADSIRAYGRGLRLSTAVVFGGVPVPRQERQLQNGVDILVATPGRLLDLIDRNSLTLRGVEILVLDEADQMLDLGFIHALKRIVTLLPRERQTLFFSATMPATIATLADGYLKDPVKVAVAPVATTAERVEQQVMLVSQAKKPALLEAVLADPAIERVLVFTRTKHGADKVVRGLDKAGIRSAAIHGNKSQGQREKALGAFRTGHCTVLVATDIAARGIDVEGVTHVINFDLPNVPEQYVHRIGRTARAGASGVAISFCNEEERAYLRDIEKLTRLKVPTVALPNGMDGGIAPEAPRTAAPKPQGRPQHRRPQQGRPGQPPAHGHHSAKANRSGEGHREGQRDARPARSDQPRQGRPARSDQPRQGRPEQGRSAWSDQPRQGHRQEQGRPAHRPARPAPQGGGRQDGHSIAWLSTGASRRDR